MSEQTENDSNEVTPEVTPKPRGRFSLLRVFTRLFESLQWLTERTISLLRLVVTLAMFSIVGFIIYNAYATRNTVAVKPFQVPVSVGRDTHEHAGRIIANQLNRHLLETQNNLHEQLKIDIDQPVPDEEAVLIEGESIKLPETGITIDNVIEFISGVFGRKNLSGAVYFEPDIAGKIDKLHLQLSLRGRIISLSESDLAQVERDKLPPTQKNRLNIKLISAMLKTRSKEILSIASEDHNLYYYCTRDVASIEHKGQHQDFFDYCNRLRDGSATPDKLEQLKQDLVDNDHLPDNKTIVGSVVTYINNEVDRKQLALCQSGKAKDTSVCKKIKLAKAPTPPTPPSIPIASASAVTANTDPRMATFRSYRYAPASVMEPIQASALIVESAVDIAPTKLSTLHEKCEQEQTDHPQRTTRITSSLEQHCFSPQKQQTLSTSSEYILQSNKYQEDALQQYTNKAYPLAVENYQQAIRLNCNHDVAWGNLGVLLSKADTNSEVRDVRQGQCALLRATQLAGNKFWLWHSLCVAQALQATENLEQFLSYESCEKASTITPNAKSLNNRLFNIEIADKYVELGKFEQAANAYVRSMEQESTRSRSMAKVIEALVKLEKQGIEAAKGQACRIYQASSGTVDEEQREVYEIELDQWANKCV